QRKRHIAKTTNHHFIPGLPTCLHFVPLKPRKSLHLRIKTAAINLVPLKAFSFQRINKMSAENKSLGPSTAFEKCSVVLVDVLGTTTSINFAKETLFPYVVKNVEEVLTAKWDDEAVKSAVKQLKEGDDDISLEAAVKLVKDLTESNSENVGLKTIQGIVYEKGYESDDLKSHVFSDVPASFESWAKSRKVAVYSTGSVESQKQLFTKSIEGDLSQYISNYFDLSVGPKSESESYKKIVEKLAVKPEEIVFITDLIEEAKAAKSAGLSTALVDREGNPKLPEESKEFTVISSFKEITFENPSKRKITDEPAVTEEPPSKLAKTACEKDVKSEDKHEESKTAAVPGELESKDTVEDEAMEVDAPKTVVNKVKSDDTGENDEAGKSETSDVDKVKESKDEVKESKVEVTEKHQSNEELKSVTEKADESDKNVNVTDKTEVETEKKSEEIPEKKEVDASETKSAEHVTEAPKAAKESKDVTSDCVKTNETETVKEVVEPPNKIAEAEIEATSSESISCESKSAIEEPSPAKSEEEKENQKDLANKLENGDSLEAKKTSNGEVS
ncbi:hypothetical protein D910_05724, partial [Dendroctonus ponderosae]